jgi:hypothetical protein
MCDALVKAQTWISSERGNMGRAPGREARVSCMLRTSRRHARQVGRARPDRETNSPRSGEQGCMISASRAAPPGYDCNKWPVSRTSRRWRKFKQLRQPLEHAATGEEKILNPYLIETVGFRGDACAVSRSFANESGSGFPLSEAGLAKAQAQAPLQFQAIRNLRQA